MVATSCDLNVPRCTTKAQQVRLHGSREVSSLITDPPGTPVIPCCNKIYHIWNWAASEVLRLFRRSTHTLDWFHSVPVETRGGNRILLQKQSSKKTCSTVCNLNVQVHVKASFDASPITSQLRWPGWMWQAWPPCKSKPSVVCTNDTKHNALCKKGVYTHTRPTKGACLFSKKGHNPKRTPSPHQTWEKNCN